MAINRQSSAVKQTSFIFARMKNVCTRSAVLVCVFLTNCALFGANKNFNVFHITIWVFKFADSFDSLWMTVSFYRVFRNMEKYEGMIHSACKWKWNEISVANQSSGWVPSQRDGNSRLASNIRRLIAICVSTGKKKKLSDTADGISILIVARYVDR